MQPENPDIKAIYVLAFTPEKMVPKTLKALIRLADERLRAKAPLFKQLMALSGPKTAIEIANLEYIATMHTP